MKATLISTVALLATLSAAAPSPSRLSKRAATKTDALAADCSAFPWFIGPRYATDCSGDNPPYNPTSGTNAVNATCRPLADPSNPGEQTAPFLAADVTISCGGFEVVLFNSTDCSDEGVSTTDFEKCVAAPDGQQFVAFSATMTGSLNSSS